jgi:predicted cobalt transporter CbtA
LSPRLLTALIAGVAAGLAVGAVQRIKMIPLIERAEIYEAAEPHAGQDAMPMPRAWEPAADLDRAAYTLTTDLLVGIGFALLLTGRSRSPANAAMSSMPAGVFCGAPRNLPCSRWRRRSGSLRSFPGRATAELGERQAWCAGTAIATAAGLGLIVFQARLVYG